LILYLDSNIDGKFVLKMVSGPDIIKLCISFLEENITLPFEEIFLKIRHYGISRADTELLYGIVKRVPSGTSHDIITMIFYNETKVKESDIIVGVEHGIKRIIEIPRITILEELSKLEPFELRMPKVVVLSFQSIDKSLLKSLSKIQTLDNEEKNDETVTIEYIKPGVQMDGYGKHDEYNVKVPTSNTYPTICYYIKTNNRTYYVRAPVKAKTYYWNNKEYTFENTSIFKDAISHIPDRLLSIYQIDSDLYTIGTKEYHKRLSKEAMDNIVPIPFDPDSVEKILIDTVAQIPIDIFDTVRCEHKDGMDTLRTKQNTPEFYDYFKAFRDSYISITKDGLAICRICSEFIRDFTEAAIVTYRSEGDEIILKYKASDNVFKIKPYVDLLGVRQFFGLVNQAILSILPMIFKKSYADILVYMYDVFKYISSQRSNFETLYAKEIKSTNIFFLPLTNRLLNIGFLGKEQYAREKEINIFMVVYSIIIMMCPWVTLQDIVKTKRIPSPLTFVSIMKTILPPLYKLSLTKHRGETQVNVIGMDTMLQIYEQIFKESELVGIVYKKFSRFIHDPNFSNIKNNTLGEINFAFGKDTPKLSYIKTLPKQSYHMNMLGKSGNDYDKPKRKVYAMKMLYNVNLIDVPKEYNFLKKFMYPIFVQREDHIIIPSVIHTNTNPMVDGIGLEDKIEEELQKMEEERIQENLPIERFHKFMLDVKMEKKMKRKAAKSIETTSKSTISRLRTADYTLVNYYLNLINSPYRFLSYINDNRLLYSILKLDEKSFNHNVSLLRQLLK